MRPRVAVARLFQETNALSPVPTTAADFQRFEHVREEILARSEPGVAEVPGIWRDAELTGFCGRIRGALPDAELVPLFSAFAAPGGKVAHDVFQAYVDRLLDGLRGAGPLSAVYLVLHGAMGVGGEDDAEGTLLEAVRGLIGPGVPLVASFDMHGFLTNRRMQAIDGFVAYRTFPHRDHTAVGAMAADQVAALVQGRTRPCHAFRSLPMVLGGFPNLDFWGPMRRVYRSLHRIESDPRVVTANVLCCQPWHDAPSLGWSAQVTTHGEPALAEDLVEGLADALWAVRGSLPYEVEGAAASVDRARRARWRRRFGTVCLADTSDAVGAGGVGENTALLAALVEGAPELAAAIPLRDSAVVQALWDTPVGARVDVELGGRLAPEWYAPYGVRACVVSKHDHTVLGGRSVVLGVGKARVVVTADAPIAVGPRFFRDVGLRPVDQDVCVVKSWLGFRWYFLLQNRLSLWARTRGVTDLDAMRGLTYDVPVHPFAEVSDWRPADRIRRGL